MTSKAKTLTDPDGESLNILPARAVSGHVFVRTDDATDSVIVGPFDPDELITAIREVAGIDDAPKPDPAREYTEEDFTKARFATHPNGLIAARIDDDLPWFTPRHPTRGRWASDADMAEEGWSIVTPAPSTPREALALVVDLAYEPEGDTMPDQDGNMVVVDSGEINVYSDGNSYGLPARGPAYRRLLLDPPAPVTPEWHSARIVEARVLGGDRPRYQWASTSNGRWVALNGTDFSVHRDNLADVKVIVPEETDR